MGINCEVCNGSGSYPIIGNSGKYFYDIRCPECSGIGVVAEDEDDAELTYEYPPSTAAYVTTVEQLKALVTPCLATGTTADSVTASSPLP